MQELYDKIFTVVQHRMQGLVLVLVFLTIVPSGSEEVPSGVVEVGQVAGQLVGQLVGQNLAHCHLVLATTAQHSPLLQHISR